MAEINLLKNELRERGPISWGRSATIIVYFLLGLLVLEVLAYGFLLALGQKLKRSIRTVEQSRAAVDFELGKIEDQRQEAIAYQARLVNLETLLQEHLFWSQGLNELEDITYKAVIYRDLQVTRAENKFIISGTVPSYTDLAKLILGLKKSPRVVAVNLQGSGQEQSEKSGYSFTLEVEFDSKLLLK